MKIEFTTLELSAIAKGLSLLAERIQEPEHQKHAAVLASLEAKLIEAAEALPPVKARA